MMQDLVGEKMNTKYLRPCSIAIIFHVKHNRNIIPNDRNSERGMKLRHGMR